MIETNSAPWFARVVVSQEMARLVLGGVLATLVAVTARRLGALTWGGTIAAVACGALAAAAGWGWAALLIVYFATSVGLSRAGEGRKAARTESVVAKGGARDARQVLANGGVFAACAAGAAWWGGWAWWWGAAGALAASAADTWATEIGTLRGGGPRHILTGASLDPGESGGVTLAGHVGAVLGATAVAAVAVLAGWPCGAALASLVAGVAGALADSVLGGTVQERFWCERCGAPTERRRHTCGAETRRAGGVSGVDNDVVNFLATMTGAGVALLLYAIGTLGMARG